MLLLLLGMVTATIPADTASLTSMRLVVDSGTWRDVRGSTWLPEAYGRGFMAGPAEVRLCDRLACLVLVPEDPERGDRVGGIVLGVRPAAGIELPASDTIAGSTTGMSVVEVPPPPMPEPTEVGGELPITYFLRAATLAIPEEALNPLAQALRAVDAQVLREGEGLVVLFSNDVSLRLLPSWGAPGPEQLVFYLRREAVGNPTYRFGPGSILRYGPGRSAEWKF